jgi:ParG
MSKTFKSAPKPGSLEAIEAYERRGLGHDTTPKPPRLAEPIKRLSIDMPQSLHRRFKGACARSGLAMIDEVMVLIENRTAELEKS